MGRVKFKKGDKVQCWGFEGEVLEVVDSTVFKLVVTKVKNSIANFKGKKGIHGMDSFKLI